MSKDFARRRNQYPPNAFREPDKGLMLNRQFHIVRASEFLEPWIGKLPDNTPETSLSIRSFQDVLRTWPLSRDGETAFAGSLDVKCSDCRGIFSSSYELEQHCSMNFCPGAAIIAYVMIQDRSITEGYRIEKRLIPLYGRPRLFLCGKCEQPFTADSQSENRRQNVPFLGFCESCGPKGSSLYTQRITSVADELAYQKEGSNCLTSRCSSIARKKQRNSRYHQTDRSNEELFPSRALETKPKSQAPRDSFYSRNTSQCDENELVAVSFSGPYELERVYAPDGVFEPRDVGTSNSWASSRTFDTEDGGEGVNTARSSMLYSEGENADDGDTSINPEPDRQQDRPTSPTSLLSRKPSFFRRVFKTKVSKGPLRSGSVLHRQRVLTKKTNRVRFSYAAKRRKSGLAVKPLLSDEDKRKGTITEIDEGDTETPSRKHVASLVECHDSFIHLQSHPEGLLVYDASGRQRILSASQVACLFLHVKDEISVGTAWSKIVAVRFRAESDFKKGSLNAAALEFQEALRLLDDNPALDVYKLCRAGMLYRLGQAYGKLATRADSEACYLEALGLYKRTLGRDHAKNFTILHDLGSLCEEDGYAREAAAMYQRSFAGQLRMLGLSAPETLSSMLDLAAVKVSLGDLEPALLLLGKAVATLDRMFGIKNEVTLSTMDKLSILYQKLGLDVECHNIAARIIPHCRTFFGVEGSITRDAVTRYVDTSENFDFPYEIERILDCYRKSRELESLHVVHRLGRAYMDAGLHRDAAKLFEKLLDDLVVIKGIDSREAFNALSALCVCLQNLGDVERAIEWYSLLVHVASKTHDGHHSRKRIGYAEKRITELRDQRRALIAERKEWGLKKAGSCSTCGCPTRVLCTACKITHFCSPTCQKLSSHFHSPWCIPSTTPQESNSVTVQPNCPDSVLKQALFQINSIERTNSFTDSSSKNRTPVNVTKSYTYRLDPHNFSTVRIKLNEQVNSVVIFATDTELTPAAIRYAILQSASISTSDDAYSPRTATSPSPSSSPSSNRSSQDMPMNLNDSNSSIHSRNNTTGPKSDIAAAAGLENDIDLIDSIGIGVDSETNRSESIEWITPQSKPSFHFTPSQPPQSRQSRFDTPPLLPSGTYLVVTPGREMLENFVRKRLRVRSSEGEKERLAGLELPNKELIEYAQGLAPRDQLEEAFMYVVEWVWAEQVSD